MTLRASARLIAGAFIASACLAAAMGGLQARRLHRAAEQATAGLADEGRVPADSQAVPEEKTPPRLRRLPAPLEAVRAAGGGMAWSIAGLLLLLGAGVLGLERLITCRVVGPLHALQAGLDRAAGGDYSVKFEHVREDIIGDLARSFEHFRNAAAGSRRELERKVGELTAKAREGADSQTALLNIMEDLEEERTRLAEATERLERLNKEKTEFMSMAAHELRTPLTAIKGFAALLLKGKWGGLTESQADRIARINGHAERLNVLVNDLLDISRIESGSTKLAADPIDVAEICGRVVGMYQGEASGKGQELTGPGAGGHWAVGDAKAVEQVLVNLVGNAIKYAHKGGHIGVSVKPRDGYLRVSVEDDGPGIHEKHLSKVFQEFYRIAEGGELKTQGTGLGLAIVKRLVEGMGGGVWADSPGEGKGCRFSFTLPARKPEAGV